MGQALPTDEDVHDALLNRVQSRVRTNIPAVVVSYQPAPVNRAKVQPTRMIKRIGGVPTLLPIIPAAPVLWKRCAGMIEIGRLNPGDEVMVSVCDRELDTFMQLGATPQDPRSGRMHSFTDAVVIPGLSSDARPIPPTAGLAGTMHHIGREDGTAHVRFPIAPLPPAVQIEGPAGVGPLAGIRLGSGAVDQALRGTTFLAEFAAFASTVGTAFGTWATAAGGPPFAGNTPAVSGAFITALGGALADLMLTSGTWLATKVAVE